MPSRWQRFFHQMRQRLRRLRASLCGHADFWCIAASGQFAKQYTQRRLLKPKQSASNISPPLLFHTLQHRSVIINLTPKLCEFVEVSQVEGFLQLSLGVLNQSYVEVYTHIKPRSCLPPQCRLAIDSDARRGATVYRRQKTATHTR